MRKKSVSDGRTKRSTSTFSTRRERSFCLHLSESCFMQKGGFPNVLVTQHFLLAPACVQNAQRNAVIFRPAVGPFSMVRRDLLPTPSSLLSCLVYNNISRPLSPIDSSSSSSSSSRAINSTTSSIIFANEILAS